MNPLTPVSRPRLWARLHPNPHNVSAQAASSSLRGRQIPNSRQADTGKHF